MARNFMYVHERIHKEQNVMDSENLIITFGRHWLWLRK